jgi:hypothetical protein
MHQSIIEQTLQTLLLMFIQPFGLNRVCFCYNSNDILLECNFKLDFATHAVPELFYRYNRILLETS